MQCRYRSTPGVIGYGPISSSTLLPREGPRDSSATPDAAIHGGDSSSCPRRSPLLAVLWHDSEIQSGKLKEVCFKSGYCYVLEGVLAAKLPGCGLTAVLLVESRDNPDAKGLYGISFSYFDTLAAIYGKDIATGEGAEGLSEAVSNMEKEIAL
ncbi:hypothetical protein BAE44_0023513 [Dichanthelium oligosanthes]|uniref:Uncharacterized protein n=1 Tax=Dichanthelium oligosanthes TaxID=888268 RepID=A0A1E5URN8_9POAL|nr:hypothetical protein BAE44_0023513 [Dichanthelium oligosanthes]